MIDQVGLREIYKRYVKACIKARQVWEDQGYATNGPVLPPFPDLCYGLTCGAKTRAGTPCKRSDLYASGRCKFHGGMSTGPRKRLTP